MIARRSTPFRFASAGRAAGAAPALLLGAPGSGKSMALTLLFRRLAAAAPVALNPEEPRP